MYDPLENPTDLNEFSLWARDACGIIPSRWNELLAYCQMTDSPSEESRRRAIAIIDVASQFGLVGIVERPVVPITHAELWNLADKLILASVGQNNGGRISIEKAASIVGITPRNIIRKGKKLDVSDDEKTVDAVKLVDWTLDRKNDGRSAPVRADNEQQPQRPLRKYMCRKCGEKQNTPGACNDERCGGVVDLIRSAS